METGLQIALDSNPRFDSVTAGKTSDASTQGYAGSIKIAGADETSTSYIATTITTGRSTAENAALDGSSMDRVKYQADGSSRSHTLATLDDGLNLAGDGGTTGSVTLNSTLTVSGGAADLAEGNNIGVTASGSSLSLQLAKDIAGLSSVKAGTALMGLQADGNNASQTGSYVTGLDNRTWAVGTTAAVSGRAATEDQLQAVADVAAANRTDIAANADNIAKGLSFSANTTDAANVSGYKTVKRALGDVVSIKAHDAQDGHTYSTDNLTTQIDDAGNITIAMDTQLTADKVTVGTGAGAITLDGANGTLTAGQTAVSSSGLTITGGPSVTSAGISAGSRQLTQLASGSSGVSTEDAPLYENDTNAANIGDVKTLAAKMVTVSGDGTNTKVTSTKNTDGTVEYQVSLEDALTLGTGDAAAVLSGRSGTLSLGTLLSLDGMSGIGSIGNLYLGNYTGTGSWSLTDNKGQAAAAGTYLTGLTNTQWDTADPTYVSGRVATEDQLAAVSETVSTGWEADVNGTKLKDVTPSSNTLNIAAGSNMTVSGSDSTITISTLPDVNFTTVRAGGTLTDGTYSGGILIGSQPGGGANGSAASNIASITGLQNTAWTNNSYMSGRAATEDQLHIVAQEIRGEVNASEVYVASGSVSYDASGNGTGTLLRTDDTTAPLTGIHDYYVTGGSMDADGKTLTLTRNGTGDNTVTVDMSNLYNADDRLVAADTESGAYVVDADGNVTLHLTSAADEAAGRDPSNIVISGIASQAELDQGLNFTASAMADGATSLSYKARLGNTIGIFGKQQENHTYNSNNITTTIDDSGNIRILLDDNLTATSLTAGSRTTDDAAGVDGSVTATGRSGAYLSLQGADGSLRMGDAAGNYGALVQNYGGPKFLTSTDAASPRLQYWAGSGNQPESEASRTLHTLATLEDGITVAGDNYAATDSATVLAQTLNADTPLRISGGASGTLSENNIGVSVDGGILKVRLAEDLTGLNSISLGTDTVLGNQSAGTSTGDYLTGLDNTSWDGHTIMSGRAATEDQLKAVSDSLTGTATGGFGLTADDGTTVRQSLGSAISLTSADDNLTTTADADSSAIKLALSQDLRLNSTTYTDAAGNTVTVTGNGISISGTGAAAGAIVSLTAAGLDNGGNQITNVASGLGTTTLEEASGEILNHAATIGDLQSSIASGAASKGLNFAGNSGHTIHKDLGETLSIVGTGTKENTSYSGHNVKVIEQDGVLHIELDRDFEVRSLQAGYEETAGQILLNGLNSDNTYSNLVLQSQYVSLPYLSASDGSAGAKRLAYTDGEDTILHVVATLGDGLTFSGDDGSVDRLLNTSLTLSGGADTAALSSGGNIGIVKNDSGSGFDVKLAKDLTDLDSISMNGGLTIRSSTDGTASITTANGLSLTSDSSGNYLTGLSNTTWNPANVVSGRAATEGQLQQAIHQLTDASQVGGGFGLSADDGNVVKQNLGGTIALKGDSNITTSVEQGTVKVSLNKDIDLGTDGSLKAGGITIDSSGIDAASKNITNVASGILTGSDADNSNAANIGDVKKLAGEAANSAVSGGRVFAGDDGETVKAGLGETLNLTGGQTDTAKLTDGNIGVVKNGNGDGLNIKLSSELTGLTSVTAGSSTLNSDGLTVRSDSGAAGTTVTSSGIKIAADGDGTHAVVITNSNISAGGQQIHDVASGTRPSDAVNVSQLGGVVSSVNNAISRLDSRVDRVGAGASALAALHPLEYDPEDKLSFASGFGHYRSANAAAIGAFYQPNANVRLSMGGSFGGGENMINAGITFSLDPARGDRLKSRIALTREVRQLREDNQSLREDNQKVHEQLTAMNDRLNELSALVQQLSSKS